VAVRLLLLDLEVGILPAEAGDSIGLGILRNVVETPVPRMISGVRAPLVDSRAVHLVDDR